MAGPPHSELDTYLMSRLAELQEEAKEENLSISEKSEGDLIKFTQNKNIKQPHIFLVENGNFRAVWKNDKGEQVGIQFLGDDVGQFVIFVARNDANIVARSSGRDSLANLRNVIGAAGALDLVFDHVGAVAANRKAAGYSTR